MLWPVGLVVSASRAALCHGRSALWWLPECCVPVPNCLVSASSVVSGRQLPSETFRFAPSRRSSLRSCRVLATYCRSLRPFTQCLRATHSHGHGRPWVSGGHSLPPVSPTTAPPTPTRRRPSCCPPLCSPRRPRCPLPLWGKLFQIVLGLICPVGLSGGGESQNGAKSRRFGMDMPSRAFYEG